MYPRYNNSMDTEGLQTDVMRFLAIIALCLVAILALVQRAAPPVTNHPVGTNAPVTKALPAVVDEAVSKKAPKVMPASTIEDALPTSTFPPVTVPRATQPLQASASSLPQIEVAQREADALDAQPVGDPVADAVTAEVPEPAQQVTDVAPEVETNEPLTELEPFEVAQSVEENLALEPSTPQSLIAPAEPARVVQQPTVGADQPPANTRQPNTELTAASEPSPQPLSLRFASEGDFLRLLTRRTVTLYLFNQQSALRLGNDFVFAESSAPNQVYEVLPSTIPEAILRSAQREVAGLDNYAWGVGMPPKIEASIQRWVQRVSTGELLIDRHGAVTHVEGSYAEG